MSDDIVRAGEQINTLMRYFNFSSRPVTLREFRDFWKACTTQEREEFALQADRLFPEARAVLISPHMEETA